LRKNSDRTFGELSAAVVVVVVVVAAPPAPREPEGLENGRPLRPPLNPASTACPIARLLIQPREPQNTTAHKIDRCRGTKKESDRCLRAKNLVMRGLETLLAVPKAKLCCTTCLIPHMQARVGRMPVQGVEAMALFRKAEVTSAFLKMGPNRDQRQRGELTLRATSSDSRGERWVRKPP
jgi:hypothetical protein